jgi:hypothetical protein
MERVLLTTNEKIMKISLIIIFAIFVTSCASKYPMKMDIEDYEYGLKITNSTISTDGLFKSKCVEFTSEIPEMHKLKRVYDGETMYLFENKLLLKNYNVYASCGNEINPILITDFNSSYSWDGMMRLNIYEAEVSLNADYSCKNKNRKFSSTQKSKLRKHGKMITLGLIGEEKTKAMIAAVVVLAFDAAVSDIYSQINQHCQ